VKPISPVLSNVDPSEEVQVGEGQPEYFPIPTYITDSTERPYYSRWKLDDEERHIIANGGDILFAQWTFGNPFHPVSLHAVNPISSE
jgi:hypothetical protein